MTKIRLSGTVKFGSMLALSGDVNPAESDAANTGPSWRRQRGFHRKDVLVPGVTTAATERLPPQGRARSGGDDGGDREASTARTCRFQGRHGSNREASTARTCRFRGRRRRRQRGVHGKDVPVPGPSWQRQRRPPQGRAGSGAVVAAADRGPPQGCAGSRAVMAAAERRPSARTCRFRGRRRQRAAETVRLKPKTVTP
ncbi:hypothetical protein MC885_006792 [Smutsia gigantea]|nr:hypothetical protein MC885_006792 [Smutsia gigantea]